MIIVTIAEEGQMATASPVRPVVALVADLGCVAGRWQT
jgi:hypothetical protein